MAKPPKPPKRVQVHVADPEEKPKSIQEIRDKVNRLDIYIKRVQDKRKKFQDLLDKERSVKDAEKKLVEKGLSLLNLDSPDSKKSA